MFSLAMLVRLGRITEGENDTSFVYASMQSKLTILFLKMMSKQHLQPFADLMLVIMGL
jgi:hypothetical protein